MHLWLTSQQAAQLVRHARAQAPQEACGIIGGRDGRAIEIIPIENVAPVPTTHYQLHPAQQANAMARLHTNGLHVTALYHSHPNTPPIPSQTDVRSAAYPDSVYLIIGLEHNHADLAAWQIRYGEVTRVPLYIGDDPPAAHNDTVNLSPFQRVAVVIAAVLAMLFVIAYSIYLLPPAPPIPTPGG